MSKKTMRLSPENCPVHPTELLERFRRHYCECPAELEEGEEVLCWPCTDEPHDWPEWAQKTLEKARKLFPLWRMWALEELLALDQMTWEGVDPFVVAWSPIQQLTEAHARQGVVLVRGPAVQMREGHPPFSRYQAIGYTEFCLVRR